MQPISDYRSFDPLELSTKYKSSGLLTLTPAGLQFTPFIGFEHLFEQEYNIQNQKKYKLIQQIDQIQNKKLKIKH